MKKIVLLLLTTCPTQAFAQLPPAQPFALPAIAVPPILLTLVPGLIPANVPSLLSSNGQGSFTVNLLDRGATATFSADPANPLTIQTFGLPALPGLP